MPAGPRGVWLWVWETGPTPHALNGFAGAFVRAANGGGVVGDGYNFAHNYAAWTHAYGASRCVAWTYVYGASEAKGHYTDGALAAHTLADAAPHAPAYVADIEGNVAPAEAELFVTTLRQLKPGIPIGFSSYPTRAQAVNFGVPWDTLVKHCDFGAPQVYWAKQEAHLDEVYADHAGKPVHVAVAPADASGWVQAAVTSMTRGGGASIWSAPVQPGWATGIATIASTPYTGPGGTPISVQLPMLDLSHADTNSVIDPSVRTLKALLVAAGDLASAPPWSTTADDSVRTAVLAFQHASELVEDAIVGPLTWTALIAPIH
jgi:hypothetical protein